MPAKNNWVRWIPAAAWMLLIFLFSHQPGKDSGKLSKLILDWLASIHIDFRAWFGDSAGMVIRKLAHFTEYGILFLFLLWPLSRIRPWPRSGLYAVLGVFCYACTDELHQTFIPKRVGQFSDVLIDTAGAVFLFGLCWLIWRWRKSRRETLAS